jgi:PAS domain S-box-containing protein
MTEPKAVLLLVDDSTENLFIYEEIIATHLPFCSTVTATDADTGLHLAREAGIDAALVDVQMPGITGIEMCRRLKADEITRDIPVMLITAQATSPSLKAEGLDAGAEDFLSRPIDNVELVARVKVLLRMRRAEKEWRALADRLEELVEGRTAALRESEARYRRLTENAQDMVWRTDSSGRVLYVNQAAERLLGISPEDAIGLSTEDYLTPESIAVLRKRIKEALSASPPRRHYMAEVEYRHKDGHLVHCEIHATWVLGHDGKVELYEGITRDNTERRKAEKEKAELKEQYRQSQKMESVGRLAGGVAHDFNNLLTVILGSCFFIREQTREGDPLFEDVCQIESAGKRAVSLTRQLLAFSRRQTLRPEVLDLNRLLEDLQKMLGRLIGEDIELVTLLGPDLWPVEADPGQIEQIVMNLAVNARDAMPDGGKLIVETANLELDEEYAGRHIAVQPGPYVMIAVSDTGVGMDTETRDKAFDPFFTTKDKSKGTGLGLSTVYGIVKQSGGNIWIYSEPGTGTTVKIYLPRTESVSRPKTGTYPLIGKQARGSETVLVVEDEEAVRSLTVRLLERRGYKVLQASDGLEAQTVADEYAGPIHLLLTDVVMPGPSGAKTAQKLLVGRPQMKVLFMSGYTDNAIVYHGVLDPGTSFIEKPFSADSLARAVRQALDDQGMEP